MPVMELVHTARVLGPRHLFQLVRARRLGVEKYVRGHYVTRVISTLFNVGFFDELAATGSIRVEDFAAAHSLDAGILHSLCEYLYALKMLEKRDDEYMLAADGRLIQSTLRGLFDIADAYEDVPHHLEALLRQEMRYGKDIHRNDERMVRGSGAGGRLLAFPVVIDLIRQKGFRHPLDLACGDATFLIDLCKKNSDITAYGLDISSQATAYASQRVAEHGLSDRIHLVTEDMFEVQRIAGQLTQVDLVTSFYGFQELLFGGREKVLGLLAAYRTALPGASFMVCEIPKYSAEELRKNPRGMLEYQLYHALTRQRLATRSEWMTLWREAGFRTIEEHYLDFARTVIYTLTW